MKKQFFVLIVLYSSFFSGCNKDSIHNSVLSQDGNETIIYIHEKTVLCDNGEMRATQCLQSRNNPSDEWQLYYEHIIGFEYIEGYSYKLKVNEINIEEPMADASSVEVTLIEILEKTLIENGVKYEL